MKILKKKFKPKDAKSKFKSREEAFDFLRKEIFLTEHFIEHVTETAKHMEISYALAYYIITNHLTDLLYEIDLNLSKPKKNVMVRIYGYCSLKIGYLFNKKPNNNRIINEYLKRTK